MSTQAPLVEWDSAVHRMNAMYRYQRYIYDATRKYYLFGRDHLLKEIAQAEGNSVLELGCGTGRNLIKLAHLAPSMRLYGIDVSDEMLTTARASIKRTGMEARIRLAQSGVQAIQPKSEFGLDNFDAAYFSYVLSMIDDWQTAVRHALSCIRPGGTLGVVDFCDQSDRPGWRRIALLAWLNLFHVHPRREIEESLYRFGELVFHRRLLSGYAYLIVLRKTA